MTRFHRPQTQRRQRQAPKVLPARLPRAVRAALEMLQAGASADDVAKELIMQRAERALFRVRLDRDDSRQHQVMQLIRAVRDRSFDDSIFCSRRILVFLRNEF